MAIKRVKSFSPYSYNLNYRRPGSSPFKQLQTYIPNATGSEVEYVVRKKDIENYFTYINNEFNFLINDDCEISLNNYSSIFYFLVNKQLHENEEYEIYDINNQYKFFNFVVKKDSLLCTWVTKNLLKINHNLNSKIDLIIIKDNIYNLDFTFNEISLNEVEILFNNDFTFNNLKVIIYDIKNENFQYDIIENNQIFIDNLNDLIFVNNSLKSSLIKSKLKQINNEIKIIKSLKINSQYLNFQSAEINNNFDYINQINDDEFEIYQPVNNFLNKIIKFTDLTKLAENNYFINIKHYLNGYINFIINDDYLKEDEYKIKFIDKDEIQLNIFKNIDNNINDYFSIFLFKIGNIK